MHFYGRYTEIMPHFNEKAAPFFIKILWKVGVILENIVNLKDIEVVFEDGERILKKISLDIKDKEFVTFLGPSGCGKTTTLRIIGGFLEPTSGDVFFEGKRINGLPPYKRNVNTVFQRYALFPHLNVYENIAFGLRVKKLPDKEVVKRVGEMWSLSTSRDLKSVLSAVFREVSSSVLRSQGRL